MHNSNQMLGKGLVQRFIDLYNSFEIKQMIDLFTDDCIFQSISHDNETIECHGKEELFKMADQSAQIFSDRKQIVTNWIVDTDKIAVEIEYAAILAQDLPGGLKKGDSLKLKGISLYEFADGKIKRLVDFS
ncbi:nuclear transport factor 2 family protein [Candidatus Protochlamydia phocaeensis]|uniref:nuclear transport factor 2 family protein n=1 Tax=Candidatus Protochlamydia phocaeensis TaxID=1414722 RepID=UPI000838D08A|nr:nuclear transport factor 2 family protein [Candidatus Protochlamydia phocaeensis]